MGSMCWSCSMRMHMAATHGCNTEQTIATRSVSDSSYTIPFAGEQEPKCDKKDFKTMVRMSSQIVVNERVKNKAVTQFCSLHLNI